MTTRDKRRLLIIFVVCIIGLNISSGIVQPDILLLLTKEAECNSPSGIGALFGFLLGMLTSPAHMSDCTLMATGQTNGVNTKNTVSSTTLVTGSTMPPGIEPPVTSTIAATICGCPPGFTRIPADSGNCYLACDSNSDWLGAVLACRGIGAYLWEPNTDEEVGAVAQAILNNSGDKFWTGATDQVNEDMPSFVLGSELTFTLTAVSDGPNSDCVAYEPTNFIYRTCFVNRKCVCERNFCVTTTT